MQLSHLLKLNLLLVFFCGLYAESSLAFKPYRAEGLDFGNTQGTEDSTLCTNTKYFCHHFGMTREVLSEKEFQKDGKKLQFTENAKSEIAEGVKKPDGLTTGFFQPELHCDADQIQACSKKILYQKNKIIELILENDKNSSNESANMGVDKMSFARDEAGIALHIVQDFYAHSNWAATHPHGETYPALLQGAADAPGYGEACNFYIDEFEDLYPNIKTKMGTSRRIPSAFRMDHGLDESLNYEQYYFLSYKELNPNFVGLTTAYFGIGAEGQLSPHVNTPDGGCSHGGDEVNALGINNDHPNRPLHNLARAQAMEASYEFINDIISDPRITYENAQHFAGNKGARVTFVIDTTISMQDEIESVKESVRRVVETTDEPEKARFSLVEFGDPKKGKTLLRNGTAEELKSSLTKLELESNADCTEYSLSGINNAIDNAEKGASIFLYTDDNPKDIGLLQTVLTKANQKNIRIHPILSSIPCTSDSEAYTKLAHQTLGVKLTYESSSELETLDEILKNTLRNDFNSLSTSSVPAGENESTVNLAVDSSITTLTISAYVPDIKSLRLIKPDGTEAKNGESGIAMKQISSGALIQVESPSVGDWGIVLSGTGDADVVAYGNTEYGIRNVEFLESKGREGHQALFRIDGTPVKGQPAILSAEANFQDSSSTVFQFLSSSGSVLAEFPALKGAYLGDGYYKYGAKIDALPDADFRVVMRTVNEKGQTLKRGGVEAVSASSLGIKAIGGILNARSNSKIRVPFALTNYGDASDYSVYTNYSQSDGMSGSIGSFALNLKKDESRTVYVDFNVGDFDNYASVDVLLSVYKPNQIDFVNSAFSTIQVRSVENNQQPVAYPDSMDANINTTVVSPNLVSNDLDLDSDQLSVYNVDMYSKMGGYVASNNDGTISYTPRTNFVGEDEFSYVVTDGTVSFSSAVVTVTVSDPSVVVVDDPASDDGSSDSRCFIATAAYGSYLSPEVLLLREFRDRYLLTSYLGKQLVTVYYQVSPPIAKYLSENITARTIARWMLTPIVYSIKYPLVFGILFAITVFLSMRKRFISSFFKNRASVSHNNIGSETR